MPALSHDLYSRCRQILLKCSEFDSQTSLQSIFVTVELKGYRDGLLTAQTREERVDTLIAYLHARYLADGSSVFLLFLAMLRDRQPQGDLLYHELNELYKVTQQEIDVEQPHGFTLNFANREREKEIIYGFLQHHPFIQVHAPAGLGKTSLMREIEHRLALDGWYTTWLDLAADDHAGCQADRYLFLQEFARQLPVSMAPHITHYDEDQALNTLGRQIANIDRIILFLDNADRGDRRLLKWIRAIFLSTLNDWTTLSMIGSGQQIVQEWQGYRARSSDGRPFYDLTLSSFDDPVLIGDIIEDVVARFGIKSVQRMQATKDENWKHHLRTMIDGLVQAACGHPLAIERILNYAVEKDGLRHASFFTDQRMEICDRCLAPIVGERILPTIDRSVREAFRSLCVFRYVWLALLRNLIQNPSVPEIGDSWEPFEANPRSELVWWANLQDTHLIHDATTRQMHPISPVIRQIVAQVLEAEDPELYRVRNRRARHEYISLLQSDAAALQKAAWLLEVFYHGAQDTGYHPDDLADIYTYQLTSFLDELMQTDDFISVASKLLTWMREDSELATAIGTYADPSLYDQLMDIVEQFISESKVKYHA
jgi:hypothetical protein